MTRKTVSMVIPVLLVATALVFAVNIQTVKSQGETVYILADGSIFPADAPMTTFDNVTYTLTDNLTVLGIGIVVERDNIVIDGANYTISGFLDLAYPSIGIDISGRSNVTIVNTKIRLFLTNILLSSSVNSSITRNYLGGEATYDIECDKSANNSIFDNHLGAGGILLIASNYTSVYANSGGGIRLRNSSDHNVIFENDAREIYLDLSYENIISRNNMRSDILIDRSDHNSIIKNKSTYAGGIRLGTSSYNNISGNILANGTSQGIHLVHSHNNSISNNSLTAMPYGIIIFGSSNNSVVENSIVESTNSTGYTSGGVGFTLIASSFNYLVGNNISQNNIGFDIIQSANNTIYHNNLVGNDLQVKWYTGPELNLANNWDDGYSSGGNYWSDYNGTDLYNGPFQNLTGSDGIGDTPYVINAINTDRYPLIPEFPALLTIPLLMTLTFSAALFRKRRRRMASV